MGRRKFIELYYADVSSLVLTLNSLVNSYRALIGGADELNKMALAKKSDVKKAIKRADDLGDIIDEFIDTLDSTSEVYLDYCKLKADYIRCKSEHNHVEVEIDEVLKIKD